MEQKNEFPLHISCGAILTQKNVAGEIEVLLLHRLKSDAWQYDSWHLPKGTQDADETYQETVTREVFEETGYRIVPKEQIGELYSTYERDRTTRQKRTIYFRCEVIKKENEEVTEHDELKWVPLDEAILLVSKFPIYEKEEDILQKFKESM